GLHHFNTGEDAGLNKSLSCDEAELFRRFSTMARRSIVLLGHTGVGKSASGNTILGRTAFESRRTFISVTTEIKEETDTVFGREISVIDTPGILSEGIETEIQTFCKENLDSSSCLFLVVVKIDRFTKDFLQYFPSMFGPDALRSTMVLFTHGDDLGGESFEEKIGASRDVSELLKRCEGRYCVFDNTQSRNRQQVRNFLQIVDKMVQQNGEQRCDRLKPTPFPQSSQSRSGGNAPSGYGSTDPRSPGEESSDESISSSCCLCQCLRYLFCGCCQSGRNGYESIN
uniref:AIG1-type G domain-containing protein n=1 Tax=Xiphophorus couchianus TaxID=32473 RepID=A0A3B5MXA3_9TELE